MRRFWLICAVSITLALGLACGGGATAPVAQPPAAKKPAAGAKKMSKTQAAAAKQVAQAKTRNGQSSPDGSKKLQVERKKQKAPNGEIVWVVVEEWVPASEWHDEVVVV